GAGAAVDPAVEAHRHGREAVPRRVVHVHGHGRAVAARAHGPETRRIGRFFQAAFHRGQHGFRVDRADGAQGGLLGELGGVIEGPAYAYAYYHRRAMLRTRLQDDLQDVAFDGLQRREGENLQRGPAPGAERLGRTGNLDVVCPVDQVE